MSILPAVFFITIFAAFGAGFIIGFVACAMLGADEDKNPELKVRTTLAYRAAKAGLTEREAKECAHYGSVRLANGENSVTATTKGIKYIRQRARIVNA